MTLIFNGKGFDWKEPEKKTRRRKVYTMTDADIRALEFLYALQMAEKKRTHPNLTYYSKPKTINLTKTNDMEFAARELFRLHGYKLQSHKVKGQKITPDAVKVHYDFTGKVQLKETIPGKWAKSAEETGTADQYGLCRDKQNVLMSIKVETKNQYTKDSIKEHQEARRQEWVAMGGTHVYMTTFSQFLEWCFDNVYRIER